MNINIYTNKIHIYSQHLKLDTNMDISIMYNYEFTLKWIIFIHSRAEYLPIAIPIKIIRTVDAVKISERII